MNVGGDKVITVIVADDHEFVVAGIADLLTYVKEIHVAGRATSAQEAVEKTLAREPDVLILDMIWNTNKEEGLTAIRRLKQAGSKTSILAMSAYDEMLPPAQAAGASVVIHKDFIGTKETLVKKIKDAYRVRNFPAPTESPLMKLSDREQEVLQYMCTDLTLEEIGDRLYLARATVAGYATNIYNKLGVNMRSGAVAVAFRYGLPPLDLSAYHDDSEEN